MYTKRTDCRLCAGKQLTSILDLGQQVLSGQFPAPDEPEPPSAPLHLVRCTSCGLVQLEHTVRPEAMFTAYHYRSSVSATMKAHLKALAEEAAGMLGSRSGEVCVAPRVLDIGGNDGWLLECIPFGTGVRTLIDPSDVPVEYPGITKIKAFFPDGLMLTQKFDLIFSIACFYDLDSPLAFGRAIKRLLAKDGLWAVEVADMPTMLANVAFDAVCHEHAMYLSAANMLTVAQESGLKIVRAEPNDCNGGSVRYYMTHQTSPAYDDLPDSLTWRLRWTDMWEASRKVGDAEFAKFAEDVEYSRWELRNYVASENALERPIHLLGASTKLGVVLQHAGLTSKQIAAASDRDPRKVGRRMPGTGIPIISEEESRKQQPGSYLSVLPFKKEILDRERAAGTTAEIVSILPRLKVLT